MAIDTLMVNAPQFGALALHRYSVVYAGMPSESTYSVVGKMEHGNQASAYNLFLLRSQTDVALPNGTLMVTDVFPEEIRFRFQDR